MQGLKFAEILPPMLATDTLARRLCDEHAARVIASGRIQWSTAS